jgi:hypothetical protein
MLRAPFVACLSIISAYLMVVAVAAQGNDGGSHNAVEKSAKNARADNPGSVRELVEIILDVGPLANASPNIRDRIVRTEVEFRRGSHGGVLEAELTKVTNEIAESYNLPAYARTSNEQVRLFRGMVRQLVPHLGAHDGHPTPLGPQMTPAEAVYVAGLLSYQKLYEPSYQVDPHQWVAKYRSTNNRGVDRRDTVDAQARKTSETAARIGYMIRNDVQTDTTDVASVVHQVLDRLGFVR